MTYRVAVVGASGFAGGELLRLLIGHPQLEISTLAANQSAGSSVAEHHPHLRSLADRVLVSSAVENLVDHDVVYLALPHGTSSAIADDLQNSGYRGLIVDCGADHRLVNERDWADYYGGAYSSPWTYAMPELLHSGEDKAVEQRAAIAKSKTLAVPGCNATAVTLALLPGINGNLLDTDHLVANLAVGYSGAGKSLKPYLLANTALGNAQGYSMGGTHRHIPEICQNLSVAGANSPRLVFSPILIPATRGILATVTAPYLGDTSNSGDQFGKSADRIATILRNKWESDYNEESLVELLPVGQWPTLQMVCGSAKAILQVAYDKRANSVVMQCAIDNLGKGTAAAAVQSTNLALGLPELMGLPMDGVAP